MSNYTLTEKDIKELCKQYRIKDIDKFSTYLRNEREKGVPILVIVGQYKGERK
tara:strand:- start:1703 stop:1861 length:159 start_codon:yes stop_codon:yes gene_type:complete